MCIYEKFENKQSNGRKEEIDRVLNCFGQNAFRSLKVKKKRNEAQEKNSFLIFLVKIAQLGWYRMQHLPCPEGLLQWCSASIVSMDTGFHAHCIFM